MILQKVARYYFRMNRLMMNYQRLSAPILTFLLFDRVGWGWFPLALAVGLPLAYMIHRIDKEYLLVAENQMNLESNPYFLRLLADMEKRIVSACGRRC